MSAQPNRQQWPGPGPGRFALTPNEFPKPAPKRSVLRKSIPTPTGRRAADGLTPPHVSRVRATEKGSEKQDEAHMITGTTARPGECIRDGPNPRLHPATRSQPTRQAANPPTAPQGQPHSTVKPTGPNRDDAAQTRSAHRTLNSLSPEDYMDLAAHSTPAQIASQFNVKVSTVWSQLSKMVRQKADGDGRTIDNVKDELNRKRVANGVIPAADARFGVRAFQPRPRRPVPVQGSWKGVTADDESGEDELMDMILDGGNGAGENDSKRPADIEEEWAGSIMIEIEQRSPEGSTSLVEDTSLPVALRARRTDALWVPSRAVTTEERGREIRMMMSMEAKRDRRNRAQCS